MHPFLFDWVVNGHHLRPPTYGVLLALSFSLGYFMALRRAVVLGENPKHIENLFLLCLLGSLVGGRGFHVLFEEFAYYAQNPGKIFAVWEGGYTFYGSVLGAIGAMSLYCLHKKFDFLQALDICSEATAIGLFTGRLGCFFAGCCWGRPTSLPWGVTFSNPESFASLHNLPLHPTQLYESFGAVFIFLYTFWRNSRRSYTGQTFFHSISLYAFLRFTVEFFRGDDYRGYVFGGLLSYAQFVSLVLLPLALLGMYTYSKKAPLALSARKKRRKSTA